MPDTVPPLDHAPIEHVKPYVHTSLTTRALHFSICEIQSRMLILDPTALELAYTRTMMGFLLFKPEPRHMAMVGLGGGSLVKFCHRHLPGLRITVAELNPHVIALRDDFCIPPDDERLNVLQTDGAQWVAESTDRPDLLVIDGFDSDGQPAELCSQTFYDDCHALLAVDGLLVVNLHSGHRLFDRYLGRIQRSFANAVLVVDDEDGSNSIVFAFKPDTWAQAHRHPPQRPRGLARKAADSLKPALDRVMTRWAEVRA
ncbi:transferase [Ideonella sp.]|uniref:spermine/spermidine synthase domain-containing protein n=1 Tax=Ideonella sp. TaxID=1929293 RepID=UPI003BB5860C